MGHPKGPEKSKLDKNKTEIEVMLNKEKVELHKANYCMLLFELKFSYLFTKFQIISVILCNSYYVLLFFY